MNIEKPIIICTVYSAKISKEKALEIGANAFTMKPLNKTELAETVRSLLDSLEGYKDNIQV